MTAGNNWLFDEAEKEHQGAKLGLAKLLCVTFFTVAGGPFGFEACIGAGGPWLTMIGLAVVALVWALPMSLMTAELSSMMPQAGGHVVWVNRAFGHFWGFQNGAWTLITNMLDSAVYPVLFVEYLRHVLVVEKDETGTYDDDSDAVELVTLLTPGSTSDWVCRVTVVALVMLMNLRGVALIGGAAIISTLLSLSPFVIITFLSIRPMIEELPFVFFPGTGKRAAGLHAVRWGEFLSVMVWNLSGFDATGALAAEVDNPAVTYPRALMLAVILIPATYAIPVLAGLSVVPEDEWDVATFQVVAERIGGHSLKLLMSFAATVSCLGMAVTSLCTASRVTCGLAQAGQLPQVLAQVHPKLETPWVAIVTNSAVSLVLSCFDFTALAQANVFLYMLSTVLKFGSLLLLRDQEDKGHHGYRIPLGGVKLVGVVVPVVIYPIVYRDELDSRFWVLSGVVSSFGHFFRRLRAIVNPGSSHQMEFEDSSTGNVAGDVQDDEALRLEGSIRNRSGQSVS
eukprot:jgi/Mesvir1/28023/Mv04631-RA.2